ncbi:sensor histidine kinase [Bordetella pseudohinzii]|uniref:histidine kinase n=1 Tax=Bordetella pseudohinzii TaxID=1331258 RepID=A0A0J6BV34_9BORD|nr:HAMP domain-containing sensor histidine kinase [Bordetella pseudohinzii]ANY17437.1 ATPase [Bordetella pseudohinzii]KMM25659.1 ATPase [Bordetella pseudohinzii]KXA81653.1 ATPase [Bordetella pseudohinzii]KXA83107.1 ATPase [Bordetella pseudohinzii]CUI71126.1 Osmolarity sensor protein EnvZ [Bordetella pseudohinzii]
MKIPLSLALPRSLRARLILLVLGAVLLAQAATLATVSYYRHKFIEDVAIGYIATTIRTLRAALAQVPSEDRAEFVRVASQNQWRWWARGLPAEARLQRLNHPPPERMGPSGMPPPDSSPGPHRRFDEAEGRRRPPAPPSDDVRRDLRRLVQELNLRLNDGTRVALSRGPRPEIFISLAPNTASEDVPALREWLVIPLDRLDPPVATPMIVFWLGGLGLVLLLAAGFSWHITRPLTRLADAADRLAAGQPQRVEPSGPHETRVLGERFNAMLDALAESDSVRRTLLSGLPHDLKGPLSRMWLRIELADDSALKEGLRKDLQDMQHMVDQFIGFVRGTDPAAYRYAPLNLNEWISERVQSWKGAGTAISLAAADDDGLSIQGDAVALGRLLDNLIGNALHHGAPPIEVRLRGDAGHAIIEVADHGSGIAPQRRAEALRPFARLDDARTRTGNVGLGLALADAIARAHGGSLELDADSGGGLLVRIRLPRA